MKLIGVDDETFGKQRERLREATEEDRDYVAGALDGTKVFSGALCCRWRDVALFLSDFSLHKAMVLSVFFPQELGSRLTNLEGTWLLLGGAG